MTRRQYLRLLLVAFVPLLIGGVVLTHSLFPLENENVLCEEDISSDYCRSVGWGSLNDSVRADWPAWFDVTLETPENPPVTFSATQRLIPGVTIQSARPYLGNRPEAASEMASLVGRTAGILLGIENNERSLVGSDFALLYCNNLNILDAPATYEAGCYGDGWSGIVTFTASGGGLDRLRSLEATVRDKVGEAETNRIVHMGFFYPMLVYSFLIGSLAVFLIGKAYRFVKNG